VEVLQPRNRAVYRGQGLLTRLGDPPRAVSVAVGLNRGSLLPYTDRGNNVGLAARCYLPHGRRSSLERNLLDPVGRPGGWHG
jgi:hypothetical protein